MDRAIQYPDIYGKQEEGEGGNHCSRMNKVQVVFFVDLTSIMYRAGLSFIDQERNNLNKKLLQKSHEFRT